MLFRTKIRQDVLALLNASTGVGQSLEGTSVYDSWPAAHLVANLPAISVSTPTDGGEAVTVHPPTFKNTVQFQMLCVISGAATDWAVTLDDLCETAISIVTTDAAFISQFESFDRMSTQIGFDAEGESPYAAAEITMEFTYSEEYQPAVSDSFTTLHVDIDVDGDGTSDKTLVVTPPQ